MIYTALVQAIDTFIKVADATLRDPAAARQIGDIFNPCDDALGYTRTWGPYKRRNTPTDQRMLVIVEHKDGTRHTMSYPRYLMERHLGRRLDENETVDHIDRDSNNNNPSNLQLLPRKEHSALDTKRVKLVEFKCAEPDCGKTFERSPRLIRDKASKGKAGPFCSRSCASRYARKVQLGLLDKLPPQQHIPSEYYRRDKMAECAERMIAKYGALFDL